MSVSPPEQALPGIPETDDTALAPRAETCPSCGAPIGPADRFCGACGTENPAAAPADGAASDVPASRHLRCQACGAEVATEAEQRSFTCPFCESNYVVEFSPETSGRDPPEFVIGFQVTPEKAEELYQTWLKSNSWFRPKDLQSARVKQRLRGVYLPCWTFNMLAESHWSASIGEYWYRTETYTTIQNGKPVTKTRRVRETEWWDLAGRHHAYHRGHLVSASKGLKQGDLDRILPFRLADLQRYHPGFLAGWLCEEYVMTRNEALVLCEEAFRQREYQQIAAFMPGDTHRHLHAETSFCDVREDLVLLPMYLLTYQYGDKLYRFLLNGQTGKIAGDKPISAKKIATAVAAGVIAVLLFLFVAWLFSS